MWALVMLLFLLVGIVTLALCKAAARADIDMMRLDAMNEGDDWQDA